MIKKFKSTHTSRTLMFAELEKVMSHSIDGSDFAEILLNNVTGKKSSSNIQKTATHLKSLYGFDLQYAPFAAFKYFWKNAEYNDRPMLALIYAINEDDLLAEGFEVIMGTPIGEKATIEAFESVIEKVNRYSSAGASMAILQGKKSSVAKAVFRGLWAFFRTYILRFGFLDGQMGLVLAISNAEGTYYRYLKIWLMQKNLKAIPVLYED